MEKVIVTDIKMKFWSMVWFMVKWSLASIPALVIFAFIVVTIFAIASGVVKTIVQ